MDSNILEQYFAAKLEAEWGPHDLNKHREAKDGNLVVLDTRGIEGYAEEHIPGAINIPEDQIDSRLSEIPKNKTVVTYCWTVTCHIATRAALKLAQKGYDVKELAGGITEWKSSGFPTTKEEPVPAR